jgi:hypothetical protein
MTMTYLLRFCKGVSTSEESFVFYKYGFYKNIHGVFVLVN